MPETFPIDWEQGELIQYKDVIGIIIMQTRRSDDRLIFIMGILIVVRRRLYIDPPNGC